MRSKINASTDLLRITVGLGQVPKWSRYACVCAYYFRSSILYGTCCLSGKQYTIGFLRFCKQVSSVQQVTCQASHNHFLHQFISISACVFAEMFTFFLFSTELHLNCQNHEAYGKLLLSYTIAPSPTLYDVPFSHNTCITDDSHKLVT